MIWSVPEQIAYLSEYYTLEPGDLIYSGTPAGVGPVKPGDEMHAGIDAVGELKVKMLPALYRRSNGWESRPCTTASAQPA